MINDRRHTASENVTGKSSWVSGRFQTSSTLLAIVLVVIWIEVLLDPQVAWLVLILLGSLGITLGLMGAAMGLGLVGFGLCTAGDRVMSWLRRSSQWPDE